MKRTGWIAACVTAVAILFFGCSKERISGSSLEGEWTFSGYTYTYWGPADDTTSYTKEFSESGYLRIDPGTETDWVFGTGRCNLPLNLPPDSLGSTHFYFSDPVMSGDTTLFMEKREEQTGKRNLRDFCLTEIANMTCEVKLVSKNTMHLKILLRQTTGIAHPYTYAFIELTK